MTTEYAGIQYCPLRYQAINSPDKVAVRQGKHHITFEQFDAMIESCLKCYRAQNLVTGNRIAVLTENPLDTIILALACLRVGWVFAPVNPALSEKQRKAYCQRIGASLLTNTAGIDLHNYKKKTYRME